MFWFSVLAGDAPGNQIQSPMGEVILGGLLSSTFLNLVVVPVCFAAILITASTACGQMAERADEEANRAAGLITEENLRMQLGVIAHDSMRGRDTPSPELTATAVYIANQFRELGLEPGAGEGCYDYFP